jgi:hypothetical protein
VSCPRGSRHNISGVIIGGALREAGDAREDLVSGLRPRPRSMGQRFQRCAFVRRQLRARYPHGRLVVVMDNLSIHTTPEIRAWLAAQQGRVRFEFLPLQPSPDRTLTNGPSQVTPRPCGLGERPQRPMRTGRRQLHRRGQPGVRARTAPATAAPICDRVQLPERWLIRFRHAHKAGLLARGPQATIPYVPCATALERASFATLQSQRARHDSAGFHGPQGISRPDDPGVELLGHGTSLGLRPCTILTVRDQ